MNTSGRGRFAEWWNQYWFPPSSTLSLACCRILVVAAQLFWFLPSLTYQINLLQKNPAFIDAQPIIRLIALLVPRDVFFTPAVFTALHRITIVAGVLALVGLFTRTALFLLALGIWIFTAHAYSYGDLHHPEALFAIFLMVLPLSPVGERLSLDAVVRRHRARRAGRPAQGRALSDMAMWPLRLVHVLLAMTYFSTGITKVLSGGLAWMNGYTVAIYTFGDAIQRHKPLGIWIAQHHTLCVLLGAATIGFETFYFLSLFLPRFAPLFFLSGILFHLGLYVAAGQPFYQHMVLNAMLLVFYQPAWVPALASRASLARTARPVRSPQPS